MTVFQTEREKHIHMARIFIAQARATSKRDRAAMYLEWAATRRRLAQGIKPEREESPRGWWRTPRGIIVQCHASGFNGWQCFSTPVERAQLRTKDERRTCWPWIFREFTVRQGKFRRFLARCQFLGTETPREAIEAQIARFARLKPKPAAATAPAQAAVVQLEMFA